jgi:hypothetical protein
MSIAQTAGRTACVLMLIACPVGFAQDVPASRVLPAETEIHLRMLEPVASNTHKHGDRFKLEVAEPLAVDGDVVIPAGAAAVGEVVHAAKAGFGGKGGELILTSRFVRVGAQELKLRSFSAGNGSERVNLALGLSFVLVGVFVQGNNIAVPAGADVFAKVAGDSELPVIPPVTTESTTEIDNNETSQH